MSLPASHPLVDGRTSGSPLVRAYRGERQPTPPILFADAVVFARDPNLPILLAGRTARDSPIRSAADVLALRPLDPDALAPISAEVAAAVADLGPVPLVGLAAAPFTLASFLVEGGPSADHLRARAMMYADPHAWAGLLNWCADVTGAFLRAQVLAGASAAHLSDPTMGSLSRRDYQRRVAPHSRRAFDALRGLDVPRVHAGPSGDVIDLLPGIGATVVAVDRRLALDEAVERLGGAVPLQGNLDPALLSAPWPTLAAHVDDVLDLGRSASAHVLDLGGDLPERIDPEILAQVVRRARGEDASL